MYEKERRAPTVRIEGRTDLPEIDIPGFCDEMIIVARCGILTGLALLTVPPLAVVPIIKGVYHLHKAGGKLG